MSAPAPAPWLRLAVARGLAWLVFFLSIVPAPARTPTSLDYFARTWKTDNGLPDNTVPAIIQTHDGYLWLGTYGGLVRFDGEHFTVFNSANETGLQSDRITSLFEDSRGTLWIGHESGDVTSYRDGRFEAQEVHETGVRRKISAIGEDEAGDIWLLNEEGTLVRVRDGAVCTLPNQDGVVLMAHNERGRVWLTSGGKLATLQQGRLVSMMNDNGSNSIAGYIQGICASHDGGLWIANNGRVQKWDNDHWTDDRGTNPCQTTITAMLEMTSGCLALGTVGEGLFLLMPDRTILHFDQANGLPHDWVRCLYEDREGTLWVGAGSGGIVALRPSKVECVNPPDGFQGRVALSVTSAHDGAVWIGSEGAGLYRLLDSQWKRYGESSGLSNQYVWCVSEDARGRMWAGTWGGGIFWQQGGHFVVPPGLENITVPMAAILHAPDGVTWIGTASGLLRYQNGRVKWFGEKDGLKVSDVRTIVEAPDGTIWFGMLGDGLGCLRNGVVRLYHKRDGLSSDYVQCLHLDADGKLWVGTYGGGLNRYWRGHFSRITTAEGLPDNFLCGIVADAHGNFWVSSHGGVFRVSKTALDRCADTRQAIVSCKTYGKGDGMPSLECSGGLQPAACMTADGRLWFPTSKGVAVINPNATKANNLPPPVVIESVYANGQPLEIDRDQAPALRIAPGLQRFEFHYTGLSFVAPEKMQFQYRLDGWENDWVNAGNKRVAEYSYLPPGAYTFDVRACNSDGVWNEAGAQLTLTVLPHFWQTWWFHATLGISLVLLVAGSAWYVSRRRLRFKLEAMQRQQTLERERTRIAKDIHDHLGANLTRISLLSQSAHGELTNPAQAAAQLDRIYDTSRELTRAMDEIVWAVNPQHDTLDSLANYLANFAQDYLVSIGMRCRIEVPLHLPSWPVSAEMRHNVFLAFKEALHNVVKHSGATEVSLALAMAESGFSLTLRDNGRGFSPDHLPAPRPGHGNGLKSMRQRLEKIGGLCDLQSAPGRGTEVRFVFSGMPLHPGRSAPDGHVIN